MGLAGGNHFNVSTGRIHNQALSELLQEFHAHQSLRILWLDDHQANF